MKRIDQLMETSFGEPTPFVWGSEQFLAGLYKFQGYARLTIRRADGSDLPMSWEDLQKVKSDCGFGDLDAVEVYPRDQDVVNLGNSRHLYLLTKLLPFAMRCQPGDQPDFFGEIL